MDLRSERVFLALPVKRDRRCQAGTGLTKVVSHHRPRKARVSIETVCKSFVNELLLKLRCPARVWSVRCRRVQKPIGVWRVSTVEQAERVKVVLGQLCNCVCVL
jgi:hypothetical protein